MIPYKDEWATTLHRIVISGPEGTATLDRDTNRPTAIVIDRVTGRIRAILRDYDGGLVQPMGLADAGTEVLVSYGIPGAVPN